MTNCYSALFFTLNMQIFSTALYSGIRRKDQEKREKIFRNICKVKNNPYLCTAFEKQGSSHEELWRGGRVVDCGGLVSIVFFILEKFRHIFHIYRNHMVWNDIFCIVEPELGHLC